MSCDYLRNAPIRRLPHPTEENPIWSIIGSVISSIVAVAVSLPFLLIFVLVVPAYLSVKWLLLLIQCNRQGHNAPGPESVRGNDSRWLGTEWRSSVIHAVLVFEAKEGVNVDHFRRLLLKRVIPFYPRLTQRLILLPILAGVGNCWMTDAKFSIDQHVFSGPSILSNEKELQDYVSKLVADGLPEDKSPWQLQVFQSFGISQDTVVILRVHQSVADGTALMRLLCHSLADSQVIEIPERPRSGALTFCMNVFRACIVGPLTLLLWVFFSEDDCNILTHRSTWTGSVTVTWSASITLPKVVRIKQVTRSTVNCVLLSALAGALRRLLQGCGVTQPPDLKVVVPVDLRDQTSDASIRTKLGNKTSSVTMPLPVAVEGCVPRLWATRKTLDSLRSSADPVILYVATAALMSIGSASFARHLVNYFTDKASLQFSSIPGPISEVLLEGQALKGIYPILPAQANLGISVTTMTYADRVFVSVLAERALGPAAELILKYLEDQIEVLWKLLLNRRVPGEQENPTLYIKPICDSPATEVDSMVQKEEEHVKECKENESNGKMTNLRTEFSELVDEIKRSQSLTEPDDLDSLKCKRRASKYNVSKHRRLRLPSDQTGRNLERKNSETNNGTTDTFHERKDRSTDQHSRSNENCKISEDYVINISENNLDSSDLHDSAIKTKFAKNENHEKESHSKNRSNKQMCMSTSAKKERSKRLKNDSEKETGSLSLVIDRPSAGESGSQIGESDPKDPMNPSRTTNPKRNTGPMNSNNHSKQHYPKHFEMFKIDEKQPFQVPRNPYSFEVQKLNKFEDSDESDIVGGVLI